MATVGASAPFTAIDLAGNVFVAGSFYGDLSAGTTLKSAGNTDVFVVKLSPTGTPIWAKPLGGTGAEAASAIAVDAAGNVVLGGYFHGTVDFGKGPVSETAGGSYFLVKLSGADGSTSWVRTFAGIEVHDIDAFANNDVLVGMAAYGSADFGAGLVPGYGSGDAAIAKYAGSDGQLLWVKRAGSGSDDFCRAVTVDSNGNAFAAGGFQQTMNFGNGAVTSAGSYDAYVAKFDSTGQPIWTKSFGDANHQSARGVDAISSGDIAIVGDFDGTLTLGGAPLVVDGTDLDIFVARISTNGAHVWSRAFKSGTQWGLNIAVDSALAGAVIAGGFEGSLDVDGSVLTASGTSDAFAIRIGL
jgi:hypothetical protein